MRLLLTSVFVITWVLIAIALVYGLFLMVRLRADLAVFRHLLSRFLTDSTRDVVNERRQMDRDDPPQSMGLDFGVGAIWSQLFKR